MCSRDTRIYEVPFNFSNWVERCLVLTFMIIVKIRIRIEYYRHGNKIQYKMDENLSDLPENLPRPKDDREGDHLDGMLVSYKTLQQTIGNSIDIHKNNKKFLILCFFPMISISEKSLPPGWNEIPGARGCTPQNIAISSHIKDFEKYNSIVIGISTQNAEELASISNERKFLHSLVSDVNLQFKREFKIPVFHVADKTMYKRITLIIRESKILKVFYPVFPPDRHALELVDWLENNSKNV